MKHNIYALNKICNSFIASFPTRKKMLLVILCSVAFVTKAQHQEDSTIVLSKDAFTITFYHSKTDQLGDESKYLRHLSQSTPTVP